MLRVLPLLLLLCAFASGCFVFDELDKGKKILDDTSPKKPAAAPAANTAKPAAPPGGDGWWANAKALSGPVSDEGGNNPAVACTIGKTTRFMRKADCLSQGGHPAG